MNIEFAPPIRPATSSNFQQSSFLRLLEQTEKARMGIVKKELLRVGLNHQPLDYSQ
jgi:hypothetical protein